MQVAVCTAPRSVPVFWRRIKMTMIETGTTNPLDQLSAAGNFRGHGRGLKVERYYTEAGVHPFDAVEWEIRDAIIGNPEKPAFKQLGVEFPKSWSQNATNIVAQKYFRGQMDTP